VLQSKYIQNRALVAQALYLMFAYFALGGRRFSPIIWFVRNGIMFRIMIDITLIGTYTGCPRPEIYIFLQ
jgi:hypothetical protein